MRGMRAVCRMSPVCGFHLALFNLRLAALHRQISPLHFALLCYFGTAVFKTLSSNNQQRGKRWPPSATCAAALPSTTRVFRGSHDRCNLSGASHPMSSTNKQQ
ncbi:hypothetical protein JAAARDRAFT_644462 [Jaapia argillacea MUCL 33604]|uniref:Uncharacterized protein n=1 Tax=Jaapia argillacea MUCL 33604 TaxID=933084 RepID=A0A067PFX3_9AGAM|nr:hypothetical protein JAAARDRAFT_644462 [Jaapia argillacea MUCL 33604]